MSAPHSPELHISQAFGGFAMSPLDINPNANTQNDLNNNNHDSDKAKTQSNLGVNCDNLQTLSPSLADINGNAVFGVPSNSKDDDVHDHDVKTDGDVGKVVVNSNRNRSNSVTETKATEITEIPEKTEVFVEVPTIVKYSDDIRSLLSFIIRGCVLCCLIVICELIELVFSVIYILNGNITGLLFCVSITSVINAICIGLYFEFTSKTYNFCCRSCHQCMKAIIILIVG